MIETYLTKRKARYAGEEGFFPDSQMASDDVAGIALGTDVTASLRKPRSIQHHRWYFAMLGIVIENAEAWDAVDDLLRDVKDAIGHVLRDESGNPFVSADEAANPLTGRRRRAVKSINFSAVDQLEFKRIANRSLTCSANISASRQKHWLAETMRRCPMGDRMASPPLAPEDQPDHVEERHRDDRSPNHLLGADGQRSALRP